MNGDSEIIIKKAQKTKQNEKMNKKRKIFTRGGVGNLIFLGEVFLERLAIHWKSVWLSL